MTVKILHGDALSVLKTLPAGSVQCCVTSPPYYGLRSYLPESHPDKTLEIGAESTPDEYVAKLVDVFREVRKVLHDTGCAWLNLGDSFAHPMRGSGGTGKGTIHGSKVHGDNGHQVFAPRKFGMGDAKPKDLLGIPWMVAFALRADGWYLRSSIVWAKPNPMPESVTDRPTSAHEMVFLLAKRATYFYDADAISEPFVDERMGSSRARTLAYSLKSGRKDTLAADGRPGLGAAPASGKRNARNVWAISTTQFSGSHFAVMPPELAERCIKAGSKTGDTVLDPFAGAGTTGLCADRLGRSAVLIDLHSDFTAMAKDRIHDDCPLFSAVSA